MKFIFVAAAFAALVSGCATREAAVETTAKAERISNVVNAVQLSTLEKSNAEVPLYARVPGLWVSDRSVLKSAVDALPVSFNRPFVYRDSAPISVQDFAVIVQQASRVNVQLVGEPVAAAPIAVNFSGSLRGFVANTAQRLGIGFAWGEAGLELVQSEARTFHIPRVAVEVLTTSNQGSTAQRRDPFVELEGAIRAVAPAARMAISRSSNSITVVDRPRVMRDVERVVAHDAEQSQRAVLVRWQLINFSDTSNGEAGVGINYLLSRNGRGLTVTGGNTGNTTADVLRFAITDPLNQANGSSVLLSVLNEAGKATVARDGLLFVHNNDVREYAETTSIPYTAETSLVSIPNLGTGTSINQVVPVSKSAFAEVGLEIKLSASIQPSEEVDMAVDFKLRVLNRFKTVVSTTITQEAPETGRRQATGRARAKHGESVVFAMDSNDSAAYDLRVGLGLGEKGSGRKEHWLLLLTPVITRGAI